MCCAQTTERIKFPFCVRVTPKHCDIIVLHGVLIPLKIGVRGTSPKFTQRLASVALSHVYLRHRVMQKDQIYTRFLVNMQPLGHVLEKVKRTRRT